MVESNDTSLLESQLMAQLAEIDRKISDLQEEKEALKRLFLKIRRNNRLIRDVSRKNSINRILVEDKIINVLRDSRFHVSTNSLYKHVLIVDSKIKNSTFRSYLHRLKEKGIIKNSNRRGYWTIS